MSTILLADDNGPNRELTSVILERAGFEVVEAKDGADTLRQLQSSAPDALLLDLHLPDMDGFEVLRKIRQDARLRTLPIAAVTASAMSSEEERALASGFDAYLAKPYEPPQVVDLVRQLVNGK